MTAVAEVLPETVVAQVLVEHGLLDWFNPGKGRFGAYQWKCACNWSGDPFDMVSPSQRRQALYAAYWHVAEQVVISLQLKELEDGEQAPDQGDQRRDGSGAVPA
jgi:hypothetical protein